VVSVIFLDTHANCAYIHAMSSIILTSILGIGPEALAVLLVGTAGMMLNILMPPQDEALAAGMGCC
jgi:hypothetical protein